MSHGRHPKTKATDMANALITLTTVYIIIVQSKGRGGVAYGVTPPAALLLHLLGVGAGLPDLPRPGGRLGEGLPGRNVAVAPGPTHGPGGRAALPAPHQADARHEIDEELGGVELAGDPELACGVVEGVLVVPVVPSLPDGAEGHDGVLGGVAEQVVGVVPHEVGGAVDQPGEVQDDAVAQGPSDEESVPEVLPPEVLGDLGGHDVAHVEGEPGIALLLEHDGGIVEKVGEVEVPPRLDDVWVLLDEEPPHVREEEAPGGVVRVGGGLGELVVDTVVAGPVPDGALVSYGVDKHEEEASREGRLVRPVRPEAMDPHRDADPCNGPEDEGPEEGLRRAVPHLGNSCSGGHVDEGNIDAHGPVDRALLPVMPDDAGDVADHFHGKIHCCLCVREKSWAKRDGDGGAIDCCDEVGLGGEFVRTGLLCEWIWMRVWVVAHSWI